MGYMVELNTLLGIDQQFMAANTLEVGKQYTILKPRERAFPLHLAVLIVDNEWNFYGYAVVHTIEVKEQHTLFHFEVLSLFPEEERSVYKKNFLAAAKQSGELK